MQNHIHQGHKIRSEGLNSHFRISCAQCVLLALLSVVGEEFIDILTAVALVQRDMVKQEVCRGCGLTVFSLEGRPNLAQNQGLSQHCRKRPEVSFQAS